MNGQAVKRLFDHLDPPLWVVTAASGDRRGGLVATFVMPASIVPELPRVLVGISRQHQTWQLIEASDAFALQLIDEPHADWVDRFGLQSSRDGVDKFAGLAVQAGATGAPILNDAPGWLECRVEARFDTGDRTAYLASVIAGDLRSTAPLLRLQRMLERADPDQKRRLREQLDHDIPLDAAAINAWRERRGPCGQIPDVSRRGAEVAEEKDREEES